MQREALFVVSQKRSFHYSRVFNRMVALERLVSASQKWDRSPVSIYQGNPFWGNPIFDNHSQVDSISHSPEVAPRRSIAPFFRGRAAGRPRGPPAAARRGWRAAASPAAWVCFLGEKTRWLWVKNRYSKWNPGKWKRGLQSAVPWSFGHLILTHTQVDATETTGDVPENHVDVNVSYVGYNNGDDHPSYNHGYSLLT